MTVDDVKATLAQVSGRQADLVLAAGQLGLVLADLREKINALPMAPPVEEPPDEDPDVPPVDPPDDPPIEDPPADPPTSLPPTGTGWLSLSTGLEPIVGTGRTIRFTGTGPKFQEALDSLMPGDTLYLPNNIVLPGWFKLKPQPVGSERIVIRSETIPTGRPDKAAQLATLTNAVTPVKTILGTNGANGYVLCGLKIAAQGGFAYSGIEIGDSDATKLSTQPDDFTVHRCVIQGHPVNGMRRAISLHGQTCRIVDNWCGDCWDPNSSDAQAIWMGGGPGPYLIQGNYLAGSTENILSGGYGPKIPGMVPNHVILYRNEIEKPLAWRANPGHRSFKNLVELKCAEDWWIVENTLHGSWVGQQGGEAFVLTARGQGGKAIWARVNRIYIGKNKVYDVGAGINMLGRDYSSSFIPYLRGVTIENNDFKIVSGMGQGWAMQMLTGCEDVTVKNNTFKGSKVGLFMDTSRVGMPLKPGDANFKPKYPHKRLTFTGNTIDGPIAGSGVANGLPVLRAYTDFTLQLSNNSGWPNTGAALKKESIGD